MLVASEDVKLIELSEDRVTGVSVISVMNLRIIADTEFLLFVGEFCFCVCVCVCVCVCSTASYFTVYRTVKCGRDSVVAIATRFGLDIPGFKPC